MHRHLVLTLRLVHFVGWLLNYFIVRFLLLGGRQRLVPAVELDLVGGRLEAEAQSRPRRRELIVGVAATHCLGVAVVAAAQVILQLVRLVVPRILLRPICFAVGGHRFLH